MDDVTPMVDPSQKQCHPDLLDNGSPPGRKKATVLQAIGGYINTAIIVVQGLLLVPLYLKYIGAHTYGLWLASGGILGMLGLMNFGISSMLIQRIAGAYGKRDRSLAGAYFFNGMFVYTCIGILLGVAGWCVSIWLSMILPIGADNVDLLRQCFRLAVLAMVLASLNECLRSFSQALLRPVIPLISIAMGRIIGIGVTLWMLFNNYGLWAIPTGTLCAEGLIFILNALNAVTLFRKLAARMILDKNILREYFKTAPVLLMATIGNRLSQEADPLLITMFISPEITTAYIITRRAADIVFRLLSVITGSTMSTFSHLAGGGDRERTKNVAQKLLFLSFSLGTVGFATYVGANQAFVSLWVGDYLVLGQNIILVIALGFLARAFRGLLGQMLYGVGDFTYASTIILLEGLGRIVLAIGLLNLFGVVGVPLAFALACFMAILPLGFRLVKKVPMQFYFSSVTRLALVVAMVFMSSLTLSNLHVTIDSWAVFWLYSVVVASSGAMISVLLNWTMFKKVYRSVQCE